VLGPRDTSEHTLFLTWAAMTGVGVRIHERAMPGHSSCSLLTFCLLNVYMY